MKYLHWKGLPRYWESRTQNLVQNRSHFFPAFPSLISVLFYFLPCHSFLSFLHIFFSFLSVSALSPFSLLLTLVVLSLYILTLLSSCASSSSVSLLLTFHRKFLPSFPFLPLHLLLFPIPLLILHHWLFLFFLFRLSVFVFLSCLFPFIIPLLPLPIHHKLFLLTTELLSCISCFPPFFQPPPPPPILHLLSFPYLRTTTQPVRPSVRNEQQHSIRRKKMWSSFNVH